MEDFNDYDSSIYTTSDDDGSEQEDDKNSDDQTIQTSKL